MSNTALAVANNDKPIVVDELVFDQGVYGLYERAKIRPSPENRKRFNEPALHELAASIKAMGVAQAILIRPVTPTPEAPEEYEIVAGERRWRASGIAGLMHIPALCRRLSDLDAAKIRILENLQREDPHLMEEAEGYQLLMLQHGFTADQLVDEVKKSRAYIYGRLKLCALTPEVREQFLDNTISASTALLIARIPVPKLQVQALKEITATDVYRPEPMSYRQAQQHLQSKYMLDLKKAVFEIKDAKLLAAAGSCTKCPKRTGNQPELFDGISADVCTDPGCFAEKKAAHFAAEIVAANKKGIPILEGEENNSAMAGAFGRHNSNLVCGDASIVYFPRNSPNTRNNGTVVKWLGTLNMPPVVAYGKNTEGALVALYNRDDIQKALEALGACETVEAHAARMKAQPAQQSNQAAPAEPWPFPNTSAAPTPRSGSSDYDLAARETTFRIELYKRLRKHGANSGFTLQALRELTKLAVVENPLPSDLLNEIYEFDDSSDESVCAYVDQASMSDIQLLLIDLLVGELLSVDQWHFKHRETENDSFRFVTAMARYESIDPDQVREELFPTPIDVTNMQYNDLVDFIKAKPHRINELNDAINASPRGDLTGQLEQAATSLGYAWRNHGFMLSADVATTSDQSETAALVVAADQVEEATATPAASAPVEQIPTETVPAAAEPAAPPAPATDTPVAAHQIEKAHTKVAPTNVGSASKKLQPKPAPQKKTATTSSKKPTAKTPAKAKL